MMNQGLHLTTEGLNQIREKKIWNEYFSPQPPRAERDIIVWYHFKTIMFKPQLRLRAPCFNYLWDLFYFDNVKLVPQNIGEL
jgi:hypothetical protein